MRFPVNEVLNSTKTVEEVNNRTKTQTKEVEIDMGSTITEDHGTEEENMVKFPLGDEVNQGIYTRHTNPFKEEQVNTILTKINIRPDLTEEQQNRIQETIQNYANCFALSVSEVIAVEGAVHKVEILSDAVFPKVAHQKLLTLPQREYLNKKVQEMLNANIIEHIRPDQVKNVALTVLSQKAHKGEGLGVEELKRRVNKQCVQAGLETFYDVPPRKEQERTNEESKPKPQKW